MTDPMELEVPATPEFVGTARLFAAEAGRHLGATEEAVADLKIAISEACTGAIEAQRSSSDPEPVLLSIEPSGRWVKVEVTSPGGFDPIDGVRVSDDGLGLGLVRALFPDAEFVQEGRASTLRIVVPIEQS